MVTKGGPRTSGRGRGGAGRAAPKPSAATIAAEQARCLNLKLDGLTVQEIADKTGIPRSTVQDRLTAAMADLVVPPALELRQLELARLDRWQRKLEQRLDDGEDPVRVVPVSVKVAESRRKLLGVDAPERAEMTVQAVDAQDLELMQLITEQRARNAADLEAIRRGDGE